MKIVSLLILSFLVHGCSSLEPDTRNQKSQTKNDDNDYYENGNIRIERKRLDNGDSLWIFKQEDGGCWEENFYRDGEIYRKIVYNSDCVKSAEYELKDGKRHGEWKSYHEKGEEREIGKYKDGLLEVMTYKNEKGEITGLDYGFQTDSSGLELFFLNNDFQRIKAELKKKNIRFIETENIEVAGKKQYHFPILSWNENELNFDMIENNDTVKCLSGRITDNSMLLFSNNFSIQLGMDLTALSETLRVTVPLETTNIFIHDLQEKMTFHFEIENKKLKVVYFEAPITQY